MDKDVHVGFGHYFGTPEIHFLYDVLLVHGNIFGPEHEGVKLALISCFHVEQYNTIE